MGEADQTQSKQKVQQFLQLLPLTLAIAGLPEAEGRYFNDDQMDVRSQVLKGAYKHARKLAKEIAAE
jgi:hypothetical protein